MIMRLGLVAFVVYLPILALILGYLAPQKYPGFSFKTHWISNLGEKKAKSCPWFTSSLLLLSFLGCFFAISLYRFLGTNYFSLAMLGVLIFTMLTLLLTISTPMDINFARHQKTARFLLLALFILNIASLLATVNLHKLPAFLIIFNLAGFVFLSAFSISGGMLFRKYDIAEFTNLVKIVQKEKSFLIRNTTVFEWLVFANQAIWLFLTGVSLL